MTRLHRLLLVLAILVFASLPTLAQSTLGNMFKLGGSTTANLPASSTYTVGALIYDLDAGVPKYNDGVAWTSLVSGGGSGGGFWYDAGAGYIQASEILGVPNVAATPVNVTKLAVNPGYTNLSVPTVTVEQPVISQNIPNIRANTTYNVGLGGGRYSEAQFGFNGAYAAQFGSYYQVGTGQHVAGICANNNNAPFSGSAIRLSIGDNGGNKCDEYSFATTSPNLKFEVIETDVRTLVPFKLAPYTDAGIPTASGRTGAVVYNTSQGAPVWSDGTSWQSFGGGTGGSAYWYDGGVSGAENTIAVRADVNKVVLYPGIAPTSYSAGTAIIAVEHPSSANEGVIAFWGDVSPPAQPMFSAKGGGGSNQFAVNGQPGTGAALTIYKNSTSTSLQVVNGGAIKTDATAGNYAYRADVTGALWDFGAGGSDYAASDGIGIETPSYWESTRAFTTGAGLFANSATIASTATASYTTTNIAAYSNGSLASDSVRGLMYKRPQTSEMAPMAPHLIFDEQTFTTRLLADGAVGPPTFAETAFSNSKALILYWDDSASSIQLRGNPRRTWYPLTSSADGTSKRAVSAFSGDTTMSALVHEQQSLSMCQRVLTSDTNIDAMRVWIGLVKTVPTNSDTLPDKGVAFRYAAGTDTRWQICSHNGTTQACSNTNVTVSLDTEYTLCFKVASVGTVNAFVNGAYVATVSSSLIGAGTDGLGFNASVTTTSAAARTLYIGNLQIGSY